AAGEEEPLAVSGLVQPVGGRLAQEGRLARIVHHAAGLQCQHTLEQGRLHVLTTPRALAYEERGEHSLGAEGGRVVVGHGHAHELGRSAEALQMLDAAHGLEHRIVARPGAVGSLRTGGDTGDVSWTWLETSSHIRDR